MIPGGKSACIYNWVVGWGCGKWDEPVRKHVTKLESGYVKGPSRWHCVKADALLREDAGL